MGPLRSHRHLTDFGPDPHPLGRGGEGYCHVTNSWPVSDGPLFPPGLQSQHLQKRRQRPWEEHPIQGQLL